MNKPDENFLQDLIKHSKGRVEDFYSEENQLIMYSGALLNWVGDYISDQTIEWRQEALNIDDLYLTGTNPEWNQVIIDQCQRSPIKLRQMIREEESVREMFENQPLTDIPIMVRHEEGKLQVLNGMHRVVAAIMNQREEITAWIAELNGKAQPRCEAHVVYDLLRSYLRGNCNEEGLKQSLMFLIDGYANVKDLLRNRFGYEREKDDGLRRIIDEVLAKK